MIAEQFKAEACPDPCASAIEAVALAAETLRTAEEENEEEFQRVEQRYLDCLNYAFEVRATSKESLLWKIGRLDGAMPEFKKTIMESIEADLDALFRRHRVGGGKS